jgi:hypothetical protein
MSRKYFRREDMNDASLTIYRTVSLRRGESVDTQLLFHPYMGPSCGWESWQCRRIVIDGWSHGMKVDVELVPTGSELRIGVFPTDEPWPFAGEPGQEYPRVAEVRTGAVWIMGAAGQVRLSARDR